MVQLKFDVSRTAPHSGYEPLPSGWYVVQIRSTENKRTQAGNGFCLNVEYEVLGDEHRGRKLWENLCYEHPNQETVKIARARISAICHAAGHPHCNETALLHNIPLKIKVGLKRDKKTDELVNVINSYATIDRRAEASPSPASTSPVQFPQADDDVPPWMRESTDETR